MQELQLYKNTEYLAASDVSESEEEEENLSRGVDVSLGSVRLQTATVNL